MKPCFSTYILILLNICLFSTSCFPALPQKKLTNSPKAVPNPPMQQQIKGLSTVDALTVNAIPLAGRNTVAFVKMQAHNNPK